MKKISSIFLILLIMIVSSCSLPEVIYVEKESSIAIGENGNWFINGTDTNIKAKGEDGRETTFRINNGVFEWKYVGEDEWYRLEVINEEEVVEECSDGLILCEITNLGYMVMGYEGNEEELIIPASYRGQEVYKIADEAFYQSVFKKIKIGKNVREIGAYAFSENTSLTDVVFDEQSQLEVIGDGAFYDCDNLVNINIPNTLKKLGRCAFFLLDNLVCEYDDIYGVKYLGNDENPFLILYDSVSSNIKNVVVNENCRFIADFSFSYCSKLESIEIGEGVVSIGDSALYYCNSLRKLRIPSTVTYIGDATLNCSDALEEIYVDENNLYYDSRDNCNGIIETKTNTLIYGCQTTIIPNTVTQIRDKAFYGIGTLTNLYIPASVEKIGEYVFSMCTSLAGLEVDPQNKVFTSRDSNGINCNVIIQKGSYSQTLLYGGAGEDGKLVIPEGVTTIGVEAFRGRLLLTEITLPKSLYSIKNYAFDYCQNLKTINNKSKLSLVCKSNENGGVAYYATTINVIS